MSAFSSYGSTYFTKADEQRELEKLSDFEKLSIIDDVYGRRQTTANLQGRDQQQQEEEDQQEQDSDCGANNVINNSGNNNNRQQRRRHRRIEEISEEMFEEFYTALDNIEPLEKTHNFWHAWINHENLVNAESDFSLFIKCENNDVERAANRICEYWNMRVEIFGEVDAFKPLSLKNNPSMKSVIPYMLKMPNLLYVLPPDDSGRVVTCWDRTGMPSSFFKDHDTKDDMKIIFYVMQQLIDQYRHTGAEEVVLLCINKSSVLDLPPRNFAKSVIKTLCHCIPVKFVCIHRIVTSTIIYFAMPRFKYYMSQYLRLRLKVHQYIPSKNQALLKSLSYYGLQSHNLPVSIGGTYDEKPIWIADAEDVLQNETRKKRKVITSNKYVLE